MCFAALFLRWRLAALLTHAELAGAPMHDGNAGVADATADALAALAPLAPVQVVVVAQQQPVVMQPVMVQQPVMVTQVSPQIHYAKGVPAGPLVCPYWCVRRALRSCAAARYLAPPRRGAAARPPCSQQGHHLDVDQHERGPADLAHLRRPVSHWMLALRPDPLLRRFYQGHHPQLPCVQRGARLGARHVSAEDAACLAKRLWPPRPPL